MAHAAGFADGPSMKDNVRCLSHGVYRVICALRGSATVLLTEVLSATGAATCPGGIAGQVPKQWR